MKKLIILFVGILMLASCSNEEIFTEETVQVKEVFSRAASTKVSVCHKNENDIVIGESALQTHIDHGDAVDMDGDGFYDKENSCSATDCDDTDPLINPAAAEVTYDGIDNDCNPLTLDDDLDEDGYLIDVDCDDDNAAVNPNATEICDNGIDDNCNGEIDENCPLPAAIGDLRDGGIVFWIDPTDNTHGLVCYTEDAPNKLNWHDAMAYCAALEAGTYNDWYLPSKVEINLMNIGNALGLGNIGGFETTFYWSSTDDNSAFFAWGQYFPIGGYGYGFKSGAYNVRAVRAF
jgi:hypothetical protein